MDIGNVSLPSGGGYVSQSQVAYQAVSAVQAAAAAPQPTAAPQVPATAEAARYQEVQQASQAVQSNYFVVSDVSFTIYKDLDGDYVTRYTSLKDGSVTYYPQKALFEQIQILKSRDKSTAVLNTEA